MTTLFVSDLHLDPARPDITRLFLRFLRRRAPACDALYILGDLFEAWVGDDDDSPLAESVCVALAEAGATGLAISYMVGNRDFLAGAEFARRSGVRLLGDEVRLELYGRQALLMHGDQLCTDDVDYQRFRAMVRTTGWRERFLAESLQRRRAIAQSIRQTSQQAIRSKSEQIMDVNQSAVEEAMRRHGVDLLIHGHTHRPGVHDFRLDGRPVSRVVLGDWYHQGSVLTVTADDHCDLAVLHPADPILD